MAGAKDVTIDTAGGTVERVSSQDGGSARIPCRCPPRTRVRPLRSSSPLSLRRHDQSRNFLSGWLDAAGLTQRQPLIGIGPVASTRVSETDSVQYYNPRQ